MNIHVSRKSAPSCVSFGMQRTSIAPENSANSVSTERARIAVSGMGLCSPIGSNLTEFAENLREGRTGIASHSHLFHDRNAWAALVADFNPSQHFNEEEMRCFDRTAQMGILAASMALKDAGLEGRTGNSRGALVFGTSHGGRSQLDRFVESGNDIDAPGAASCILEKAAHYHQTAAIASKLGIHGPCVTLSNACSSSGAAIAYAMELLRSGQCDWVLAGGADGFSKLTYAGFEALGAMADGPCAPFSEPIGMSLGDGAGFLLLERVETAKHRSAGVHAELFGWGLSWDAYHITAPEPSGEGMLRAIEMAVSDAGLTKDKIDYVNIHGTGTRANDAAESVGLSRFFADSSSGKVPPLSATKSLTGHMLGASSALGLIASIVGMKEAWLPPTANFTTVRPGCELDAVPNRARSSDMKCFMAQSAAFAGANAVLLGGASELAPTQRATMEEEIWVSGIGIVSPIGCDLETFRASIREGRSGICDSESVEALRIPGYRCGVVQNYNPRKLMPALNLRRVDRVASYATIASSLALKDAGLWPLAGGGHRTGLIVAITRGAATSYEKYLESVKGERWKDASAVYFPNLVMSSVGGQVSSSLGIRGITSSLVGGGCAGLQAIAHAVELFRRNPAQDAVVVVASDEIASLYFRLYAKRGWLQGNEGSVVLGEGSVAFVLEKRSRILARSGQAYGKIAGYGLSHDASLLNPSHGDARWMAVAIEESLRQGRLERTQINRIRSLACGMGQVDRREKESANSLFPHIVEGAKSVTPLTGFAESSTCLVNAAVSLLELKQHAQEEPTAPIQRQIVIAGSDDGSNASLILESLEARK